ncbi:hypothetical protein CAEBREN_20694 [Caenorhabditis brenneri]|uniref:BTB domain-containing protein n=1 Tax=Caenorhabditis brenneri TaxID=135651 RepID=G0MV27_CAEBE|nr:hypothetical protein CAEBREN_20694 [Caenorhabditis brenneri]
MTDEPVIKSAKVEETVAELPAGDSTMKLNDVVLIVMGQKYNCSKTALSENAEFFKIKFFGDESQRDNKPEVTLEDPETPEQFEAFLKVIEKKKCLTDDNIEGVLRLSVLWQAPIVEERCLEFLTTDSKMETCQKFELAIKVNSEALKKQVLSGIESMHDIHRMIPSDRSTWDPVTIKLVFEKMLEVSGWMPPDSSAEKTVIQRALYLESAFMKVGLWGPRPRQGSGQGPAPGLPGSMLGLSHRPDN